MLSLICIEHWSGFEGSLCHRETLRPSISRAKRAKSLHKVACDSTVPLRQKDFYSNQDKV